MAEIHPSNASNSDQGDPMVYLTPEASAAIIQMHDIIKTANIIHADIDGTLWFTGIPLDPLDEDFQGENFQSDPNAPHLAKKRQGVFNENDLKPFEHRIFENLVEFALHGGNVSLITGKDSNVFPIANYLRNLVNKKAEELRLKKLDDGRWESKDGKPVIITLSTGNGAQSMDIFGTPATLDPEQKGYFYKKEIPLSFYIGIGNQETAQLLRDSTLDLRFDEVKEATPQYFGFDKNFTPQLPDETNATSVEQYILQVRQLIGDFALISPSGTKVNLVLSWEKIADNESLQKKWLDKTGVTISDQESLMTAYRKLSENWETNSFEAFAIDKTGVGKTFIDIAHPEVEKGNSVEHIEKYVQKLRAYYGLPPRSFSRVTFGDKPMGNDKTLLNKPGSATNGHTSQEQIWPVPVDRLGLDHHAEDPAVPEDADVSVKSSIILTAALKESRLKHVDDEKNGSGR